MKKPTLPIFILAAALLVAVLTACGPAPKPADPITGAFGLQLGQPTNGLAFSGYTPRAYEFSRATHEVVMSGEITNQFSRFAVTAVAGTNAVGSIQASTYLAGAFTDLWLALGQKYGAAARTEKFEGSLSQAEWNQGRRRIVLEKLGDKVTVSYEDQTLMQIHESRTAWPEERKKRDTLRTAL